MSAADVGRLFAEKLGEPYSEKSEELSAVARRNEDLIVPSQNQQLLPVCTRFAFAGFYRAGSWPLPASPGTSSYIGLQAETVGDDTNLFHPSMAR